MELDRLLQEDEEPDKVWLITYSDMVTLLLALFIVIASVSTVDESKFEEIQDALHKSVSKIQFKRPITEVRKKLEEIIKARKVDSQVSVRREPRGLDITFKSSLLFEVGNDALLPGGQGLVDSISLALHDAADAGYTISVEGHTDNVPIMGRFASNWELSTSRATQVVRHLIDRGVPKDKLMASGFADMKPKVPNDTPEHRAENRRVVIKVIR